MDFSSIASRGNVPIPLCGEMECLCRDNADKAARDLPFYEDKVLSAHDAVTQWTESQGKLEQQKRQRDLMNLKDKVAANQSDGRYWRLQAQAWRDVLKVHPDLAREEVGSKCSHGYIAPMCVLEHPELKRLAEQSRQREPGEDDE